MALFKNLFARQSSDYSRFRPTYPATLFDWLAAQCGARELAWDCGTGNGQAAVELARRFSKVVATDASSEQLKQAKAHPRIQYREARAEGSGLTERSVDLITVAQAFHWFDSRRFFEEVRRVARGPETVIAVWCYGLMRITPEVDRCVGRYYQDVVGKYWEPERRLVEEGYLATDFPFTELRAPVFEMEQQWSLDHLFGYLGTWSATATAKKVLGRDPVDDVRAELTQAWGSGAPLRRASWPLSVRAGLLSS